MAHAPFGCGYDGLIAVVMGVITGSFGGLLRDVICNEVPVVLRKGQLYATAVIAGCTLYVLLLDYGVQGQRAAAAGMATIFSLRVLSMLYNLRLPEFSLPPDKR